ncbi:hypothetical protein F4802DRAFT_538474 [Xylaria palmicola]|nr:hypothetical protein F4802DRAFT_538474 [Xylaria palmicola]
MGGMGHFQGRLRFLLRRLTCLFGRRTIGSSSTGPPVSSLSDCLLGRGGGELSAMPGTALSDTGSSGTEILGTASSGTALPGSAFSGAALSGTAGVNASAVISGGAGVGTAVWRESDGKSSSDGVSSWSASLAGPLAWVVSTSTSCFLAAIGSLLSPRDPPPGRCQCLRRFRAARKPRQRRRSPFSWSLVWYVGRAEFEGPITVRLLPASRRLARKGWSVGPTDVLCVSLLRVLVQGSLNEQ